MKASAKDIKTLKSLENQYGFKMLGRKFTKKHFGIVEIIGAVSASQVLWKTDAFGEWQIYSSDVQEIALELKEA